MFGVYTSPLIVQSNLHDINKSNIDRKATVKRVLGAFGDVKHFELLSYIYRCYNSIQFGEVKRKAHWFVVR